MINVGTSVKFRDWSGATNTGVVERHVDGLAGEFYILRVGPALKWVNAKNVHSLNVKSEEK